MEAIVEKLVRLSCQNAERLTRMAAEQGTSENAHVEQALGLLFRQERAEVMPTLEDDRRLLHALEEELGSLPARTKMRINPEDIVSITGTSIEEGSLRGLVS